MHGHRRPERGEDQSLTVKLAGPGAAGERHARDAAGRASACVRWRHRPANRPDCAQKRPPHGLLRGHGSTRVPPVVSKRVAHLHAVCVRPLRPPISPGEMQLLLSRAGLVLNPGQVADLVLAWRQVAGLIASIAARPAAGRRYGRGVPTAAARQPVASRRRPATSPNAKRRPRSRQGCRRKPAAAPQAARPSGCARKTCPPQAMTGALLRLSSPLPRPAG